MTVPTTLWWSIALHEEQRQHYEEEDQGHKYEHTIGRPMLEGEETKENGQEVKETKELDENEIVENQEKQPE